MDIRGHILASHGCGNKAAALRTAHAPLAPAHHSVAQTGDAGDRRLIHSPEQDDAPPKEAVLSGVELFCAGFTFSGWVAYR